MSRRFNIGDAVRSVLTPELCGIVVEVETSLDGCRHFAAFETASGEIVHPMWEDFLEGCDVPPGSDTGYTKHVTYTFEADGDCWGAGLLSERNMLIGFPGAEAGDCQLEVVLSGGWRWRMPESSRRRLKAEYESDADTDAMADAIEAHINKHGPPPKD